MEEKSTWNDLWITFQKNGEIDISDGRGQNKAQIEFGDDVIDQVIMFAFEFTIQNNTCFTSVDLIHYLISTLNITLSQHEANAILSELDFKWGGDTPVYYGIDT